MTPRRLDTATVEEKLLLLRELVAALAQLDQPSPERLHAEVLTRLALERALTQGVELIVSICSHVVGASGRTARTYREAVVEAASLGLLDEDLAASLGQAVGMRNLLVHEYARIDTGRLAAAAGVAQRDFAEFVRQAAGWVRDRS